MSIDTAFTHFPVLTTSRLHLRQIRPEDAEAFFAIKSDQDVADSYAQAPHQTLDDTRALIQRIQGYYDQRDSIFWSITLQGEDTLIGACSLWNFDSDFNCAEIGYELHQAYWGRGVMSEALSAILTCGFTELALHRIEATPYARNTRSSTLLLKLGFTLEGTLRQRHFYHGQFDDQLYFGLLKEEWVKAAR